MKSEENQCDFVDMKENGRCPKSKGHRDSHHCPCGIPYNVCAQHAPDNVR